MAGDSGWNGLCHSLFESFMDIRLEWERGLTLLSGSSRGRWAAVLNAEAGVFMSGDEGGFGLASLCQAQKRRPDGRESFQSRV